MAVIRPLRWYESAWIFLPAVIVFGGGALGVLCGAPAIWLSARIFRSARGTAQKFLITGAVSAASIFSFLLGATLIGIYLDPV